jgi:uncharacterized damage-inducible protein DinB
MPGALTSRPGGSDGSLLAAWRTNNRVTVYLIERNEGHHRGQIVMAARALNIRLPKEVTEGLWAWNRRAMEAGGTR